MPAKPQQIFEYLLAIKNLTNPPTRDIRDYEWFRYADMLPLGEGCYLNGTGDHPEAWLEVHKQNVPSPPKPDSSFKDWLSTVYDDPNVRPKVQDKVVRIELTDEEEEVEVTYEFNSDEERVRLFNDWLASWDLWAGDVSQKKAVQALYQYLFALHQRFQREGENLELAFGHGLLAWSSHAGRVCHPLFVTRLELTFDAKHGVFTLRSTQRGTRMETDMLSGLDLPNLTRLRQLSDDFESADLTVNDPELMEPIYTQVIQTLHSEGRYLPAQAELSYQKHPVVIDKPLVFLRQRSSQLWKEELRNAIEAILTGYEVPKTIASLLQMTSIEQSPEEQKEWSLLDTELLFPLPANEDQRDIARRLATNFGVVVQGPPGTGKSHTIANLISHLLAHGKRVLVTSHTERALRVLADKIPEQVRALCVPVLGGDLKSLQEIDNAVDALSDGMATMDATSLAREMKQLNGELNRARERIIYLNTELRRAAERDNEEIEWDGARMTPLRASQWLKEHEIHGWMKDSPSLQNHFPLVEKDLRRLWDLKCEISPQDLAVVNDYIPNPEKLESGADFKQWLANGSELAQRTSQIQSVVANFSFALEFEGVEGVRDLVQTILSESKNVLDTPHLNTVLRDCLAGGEREKLWDELVRSVREALSETGELFRALLEYQIDLPNKPLPELKADLMQLQERLKEGKASKLFFLTSGRKLKYLVEYNSMNDQPITTFDDAQIVLKQIQLQEQRDRSMRRWNAAVESVGGTTVSPDDKRWHVALDENAAEIEKTIQTAKRLLSLKAELSASQLPNDFSFTSSQDLTRLLNALNVVGWDYRNKQWQTEYHERLTCLRDRRNDHPFWEQLTTAMDQKDANLWQTTIEESKRLFDVKIRHQEFLSLLHSLEQSAPRWARTMKDSIGIPQPFPEDWQAAWKWAQLNSWFVEGESFNHRAVEEELEELTGHERRLLEQIVARSTWKNQLERVTEPQKRALQAWKQKVKRIGKGTGKYVNKYRKEAREEMEQCRGAIPVWIMPIHRVIENFSLADDKFDVVIVDESSQCDIHSLSVLLRGKKAVIVGDDEQISPAAVGVDQSVVHSFIEQYLDGVPQANSLDVQTSLYDVAVRVFPGKLMLKEHFRCVPEIIQFSNDLSYNGDIVPLRLPTESERIEPPVVAKHVYGFRSDGHKPINVAEAEAIVADMKEIVVSPSFAGQTIGVISLQQEDQARLIEEMLREQIGEEEMVNRRIVCGDAYAFQGDERDLVFISMVAATNVRFAPLVKRDAQQRFNVAASRARNQMRLYHSVDLSDLSVNDLRYQFLQYCLNPMRVAEQYENLEVKCESKFERDVLKLLLAKGYRVIPQVDVGRYRIDFVVEGLKSRLAIECDGDKWHGIEKWEEDLDRQRILERVGWKFWRVRGSTFYRDKVKAMESLWTLLDEMGIHPVVHDDIPHQTMQV